MNARTYPRSSKSALESLLKASFVKDIKSEKWSWEIYKKCYEDTYFFSDCNDRRKVYYIF